MPYSKSHDNSVIFTVPGSPQGKGRARTYLRGQFVRTVTPEKTVQYENWIRCCYLKKYPKGDREIKFPDGPLRVYINCYYLPPKSTSKKKTADMLSGKILPCKKPDIDNIAKIVLDAMNGLVYRDDTQVVYLQMEKSYAADPKVVIDVVPESGVLSATRIPQ